MKMMLAMVLSLFLAACQTTGGTSGLSGTEQQIAAACLTVGTAAEALTVAVENDKLTEAQQNAALRAFLVTDEFCRSENPPTRDEVKLRAFNAAVAELQKLIL